MAKETSCKDTGLDQDIDLWEPVVREAVPCPCCGTYIAEGVQAYWVVENPTDGFYTAYCNEFHFQAHHKLGVWEVKDPVALEL